MEAKPMIRSELVLRMASHNPALSLVEVGRLVDSIFGAIATHLAVGGRVELRGFGAFSTRAREARTGRNPRTGAPVDVSATHAVYFKPGKAMRDRLRIADAPSLSGSQNRENI